MEERPSIVERCRAANVPPSANRQVLVELVREAADTIESLEAKLDYPHEEIAGMQSRITELEAERDKLRHRIDKHNAVAASRDKI